MRTYVWNFENFQNVIFPFLDILFFVLYISSSFLKFVFIFAAR